MSKHPSNDRLLGEQIAYYRAVAPEYESLSLPGWGGHEEAAALDAFKPAGAVLELACGPGITSGHFYWGAGSKASSR